jgi:prepilin-type N-terminal cleavage/methylation domain-containing protein
MAVSYRISYEENGGIEFGFDDRAYFSIGLFYFGGEMNQKGFSLIEVLVAISIGLLVFSGIAASIFYLIGLNYSVKTEAAVYRDLTTVMERVGNTPLNSLNTLYPNNTALQTSEVTNILGGYKAPSEQIVITYPNGTSADPREIMASANWSDDGRIRTMSMRTLKRG